MGTSSKTNPICGFNSSRRYSSDPAVGPTLADAHADRELVIERRALPAGDYAAIVGGAVVAAIERKTLENLAAT
jgi:hypothetical protein